VDANTLFMAASNTKGMTTLLLAQLVDENRIGWDQPVIEVYPRFKLGDAKTTTQVLVKHLVCACTGLPRRDFEWTFEFRNATPASTFDLLASMQPTSRFGEIYQYNNLLPSAAGYIAAYLLDSHRELGRTYDEAMHKRIFAPLGMNRTTFDFEQAQKGNHARPHADDVDGIGPRVACGPRRAT
jgi:CubicO group peptidase (beta-lactamase class C family)